MVQLALNTQLYLQVVLFIATIVIGVILTRAVLMPAVAKVVNRREGDVKAIHSVQNVAGVVGYFLTLTAALQVAGFGNLLTVIGTIAGAATLAIGFAMRDQISSLIAGVFIHTDNPYVKGDYIEIDDHEGVVRDVRLRTTVIESESFPKQVIPNNIITTKTLKNFTRGRKTRRSISVLVAPEKAEKLSKVLLDAVESHDAVWEKPAPEVDFKSFDDGQLQVQASFWIGNPEDIRDVQDEILRTYTSEAETQDLLSEEES